MSGLFSSESVTPGHPDKTCDLIADSVLDEVLRVNRLAHCAVEVFATSRGVHVGGEIHGTDRVDVEGVVRRTLAGVGWDGVNGLDPETFPVGVEIAEQSAEIDAGVSCSLEAQAGSDDPFDQLGAGDQGSVFGFACDETPEMMPLPLMTAHRLARWLSAPQPGAPWIRPDGKTQVTFELGSDGRPSVVRTVVVSVQHDPGVPVGEVRKLVSAHVVDAVLDAWGIPRSPDFEVIINPAGAWSLGGPLADTGLTGRKIIVDTYGGGARHGGGAFSGKDPTKVDRSAAYAARQAAKSVVAAGLARRCEVQISYAIGRARPVGLSVDTFGTGIVPDAQIASTIEHVFDFRPAAIIAQLGLREPIYRDTACFGHFGDPCYTWEQVVDLS